MKPDKTQSSDSANIYRLIFENAVMGIYQSTVGEGEHLVANPALANIYGYDSVEDLQRNVKNISRQLFVDPNRRRELLDILEKNDVCQNFESRVYRKDGKIIWISENARAVRDESGKMIYIVGTVKDISERKAAEEKLRIAKEDWEKTFNALPDIIVILDEQKNIRRFNRAAQILFGARGDYPGKCQDLQLCPQEGNCENCPVTVSLQKARPMQSEIHHAATGKIFQINISPIHALEGHTDGVVYVARDITEHRRLEAEAEYRLQQLIQADKLRALGEMVAGIAHEIGNPIGFLKNNQIVLEEVWRDLKISPAHLPDELLEEGGECLEGIKKGIDRIKSVISSLKDYARKERQTSSRHLSVNEVVESSLSLLNPLLKQHQPELLLELSPDLPTVPGNFVRLEQVCVNLLQNAVQWKKDCEKLWLQIKTTLLSSGKLIGLYIQDNGQGIPEEDLNKIFEPFFTNRREKGGTGLGLSVSYQIVRQHGGLLKAWSRPGLGSRFLLALPTGEWEPVEFRPVPAALKEGNSPELAALVKQINLELGAPIHLFKELTGLAESLWCHPEIELLLLPESAPKKHRELLRSVMNIHRLLPVWVVGPDGFYRLRIADDGEISAELVYRNIDDFVGHIKKTMRTTL
ncbi:MAG: hypothetical protein Kow0037_21260 [Calditrichia bacterium]